MPKQISAAKRLDNLIDHEWDFGREIAVKLQVVSECCWEGELRFTPEPNQAGKADRSFVFYVAGGDSPEDVIGRLLYEFEIWRSERLV